MRWIPAFAGMNGEGVGFCCGHPGYEHTGAVSLGLERTLKMLR